MKMVFCATAGAVMMGNPARLATATPRASCFMRIAFLPLGPAFMRAGLVQVPCVTKASIDANCASSVRERPHPQFLFSDLPQPGQSVRLDNQEEDDQGPDNHEG